jgi:4-amino-4-deoxy-L-arabinose transferase-like glycosyltransferase
MNKQIVLVAVIALLLVVRAVFAAILPLSADEAYYWLWSRHLALGYYDHPPAIAWLIAAGTGLLGSTPLGVRLSGIVLSLPVTWLVWDSARLLLKDRNLAALAALFFNLTLMTSVEMLAATPDMPSVVTAALMFWALVKVRETGRPNWWIVVGVAAGLGLLSKLSVLFVGLGTLLWLVTDRDQRRWLATPWPWGAALLALLLYAPALWWQSQHQWETFAFQFARLDSGGLTGRYLGEFLAAQVGLATPLIFVLMVAGLWTGRKPGTPLFLPAILVATAMAYFLIHALHARVQGNWPCFVYPMLSVLAAAVFCTAARARCWRWVSLGAAPMAGLMLAALYLQAGWGVVPLRHDPVARTLGRDFQPAARMAATLVEAGLARAVVTTDYETTAWLRFNQPQLAVIQITEPQRYPAAPAPSAEQLAGRLLYVVRAKRDQRAVVEQAFAQVGPPARIETDGVSYRLYSIAGPRHPHMGKMP